MGLLSALKRRMSSPEVIQVPVPPEMAEMFAGLAGRHKDKREFKGGMPQELRILQERLAEKHQFAPGMIVKWKEGLRNKMVPTDDGFGVVVEVLEEPRYNGKHDAGTSLFYEPLDIILGLLDPEGDFSLFHYDSRRLRPVKE